MYAQNLKVKKREEEEPLSCGAIESCWSNKKKIACIIPAYRNEQTIVQAVSSVLNQPAAKALCSIVVSEDAGKDFTSQLALEAGQTFSNFRVLAGEKNLGEAGNVFRAIDSLPSGTEWVLILHGDDYAKPGWVERMINAISEAPEDVVSICCSYDTLDEKGKLSPGENGSEKMKIFGGQHCIASTLKGGCWWHISGCAIRLKAYQELGGRNSSFPHFGDWDLLLRFFERNWAVGYIPLTLTVYRLSNESVSAQSFRSLNWLEETLCISETWEKYTDLRTSLFLQRRLLSNVARGVVRIILQGSGRQGLQCAFLLVRAIRFIGKSWIQRVFGILRQKNYIGVEDSRTTAYEKGHQV